MIELTIDRLTNGGRGCGRHAGKTVFVPLTAAGDVVRCRIVREKKRYAEAELVAVLTPGPARITPACRYFGDCGGCQWQHLSYAEQINAKEQIFADLLSRQAGVDPALQTLPLIASAPWHYRGRAQFKCYLAPAGLEIGFFRANSHHVVAIDRCPILDERLNQVLAFLRRHLPLCPTLHKVPQFDVSVGADGRLHAVLHYLGDDSKQLTTFLKPLFATEGIALAIQCAHHSAPTKVTGDDSLFITVDEPPLELYYGAGGFVQVNQAQNRAMVAKLLQLAGELNGQRVLDLYCGIGNFALPLARRARKVVGVEAYAPAIISAKANAARAGLANTEFYARDATGAMAQLWGEGFDLVVLDPPRAGAATVVPELVSLRPPRIIYVSCDPATLARDLKVLIEGGYRLESTRVIDMFPQTFHIESISVLERVA